MISNRSMVKCALAVVPGGLLTNLVYNLALRRAGSMSSEKDRSVSHRLLADSGVPYTMDPSVKPRRGVTGIGGTAPLRINPEANSGIVAHAVGKHTNPGWTRMLRRTGLIAPVVGSIGAAWAPTDSQRRDFATYSTLAAIPRSVGELMAGTKGVRMLHAAGGSPASKWVAMSRLPYAIAGLAAPSMAYLGSRPDNRSFDSWFRSQ